MRNRRYRSLTATAACVTATALVAVLPAGLATGSTRLDRAIQLRLPLNAAKSGDGLVFAMDCVRAGYCTGGGAYLGQRETTTPMVVTQAGGHWARARQIKMPADAAGSSFDVVTSVRCATVGSCVAVGYYYLANSAASHAFVAGENRGHWAPARDIPAPKNGEDPVITSVSCSGPGSCVAAGDYTSRDKYLPMEVAEMNGTWRRAQGLRLPPRAKDGSLSSLSCLRPGFCAGVGDYLNGGGSSAVFAVAESNGTWRSAARINLPKGARADADDVLSGISCTSIGSCEAVGSYDNSSGLEVPLTVTQSHGRWARARAVTVLPANATHRDSAVFGSISCRGAGSCIALGNYTTKAEKADLMIATESGGQWRDAQEVALPPDGGSGSPPSAYLFPSVGTIDCTSTGYCAAGSFYLDVSGKYDALAVTAHLH